MKPINKLKLSSDEVHVVDLNLMLELNSCGRGFITAQTDIDYTGKLVRLEVGYPELLLRWFTGFVERSQTAENGFQKLFVRELVGVFDKPWPCSFQHPTLKTIIDYLQSNSGLTFHLPNSNYVNQPIPHFTHAGTGYQLLAVLGQSFAIDDYIWMQLPDGSVYVGSWPDSPFADKPVDIPPEFSQSQSGGNSMTVPLIQTIRPGVNINGQRVNKVNLLNESITLTWQTVNKLTGKAESKTPIQRQIESAFPELTAGLHLPMQARVIAPAESAQRGDMSDPFRPKYAVDVQLLDSNGNPTDAPVYPAVPLPLPMAGGESGMFQYPPEGSLVEIAFTGGRPDKPFIRQTLSAGNTLPDIQPGEQLQQQREEVSQRVTATGDWIRKTDQTINESSMRRLITADAETRTVTARETMIEATDTLTVLGTHKLLAGAIQQVTTGDYAVGTQTNFVVNIGDSMLIEAVNKIEEKAGQLKSSIAGVKQEIIAPVVWVGSESINIMQLMLDTLDVVKELAQLTASHTHKDTGAPLNKEAISGAGGKSDNLKDKYTPIIG